jgi:hypothetical protein
LIRFSRCSCYALPLSAFIYATAITNRRPQRRRYHAHQAKRADFIRLVAQITAPAGTAVATAGAHLYPRLCHFNTLPFYGFYFKIVFY